MVATLGDASSVTPGFAVRDGNFRVGVNRKGGENGRGNKTNRPARPDSRVDRRIQAGSKGVSWEGAVTYRETSTGTRLEFRQVDVGGGRRVDTTDFS